MAGRVVGAYETIMMMTNISASISPPPSGLKLSVSESFLVVSAFVRLMERASGVLGENSTRKLNLIFNRLNFHLCRVFF